MIKVMFTWSDRRDLTAAACDSNYRATHIPLARTAFEGVEGFRRLVYNRVVSHQVHDDNRRAGREAEADFDAFVELWFDDRASLERAMSQPILQTMFDDHPNFMITDGPATIRVYELDEEEILSSATPTSA